MSSAPDEDNLVLFTTLEILSDRSHNTLSCSLPFRVVGGFGFVIVF